MSYEEWVDALSNESWSLLGEDVTSLVSDSELLELYDSGYTPESAAHAIYELVYEGEDDDEE